MGKYGYSESGNPLTTFVNMFQTPEERRDKYNLVKGCTGNVALARRARDWRMTKVLLTLEYLAGKEVK